MSENNFDERLTPAGVVEKTDQGLNGPAINSDVFVDQAPVDASRIQETPMGGTVAAVGPLNETVVPPIPAAEGIPTQFQRLETDTFQTPVVEKPVQVDPVVPAIASQPSLLAHEDAEHFRTRWNEIQGKFVDEPQTAVQQADTLVSEVIGAITQMFTHEHGALEGQWKQGQDVSTEELRMALQHYRSFFNRLVV